MRDGSNGKIGSMITVVVMLAVSMAAGASLVASEAKSERMVVSFVGTTPDTNAPAEEQPATF